MERERGREGWGQGQGSIDLLDGEGGVLRSEDCDPAKLEGIL